MNYNNEAKWEHAGNRRAIPRDDQRAEASDLSRADAA
jgi:hypothetical protein